jgi:hypothetical protein
MKKGFFTEANLNVDIVYVQSSANLVQQLAAGSLDICMSTGLVDPIRAIDQNAGISIVRFEAQAPPYALVAKPAIKKLADLKGKVISVRRPEGHHPHLCRADAGAARRQAGRVRHGIRRRNVGPRAGVARRRRSMRRSCCRRSISRRRRRASTTSG